MTSLQPQPAPANGQPGGLGLFSSGVGGHEDTRSTWTLAIAGMVFAAIAADLLCLSPRWFSGSLISVAYQSAKIVAITAATGGAAVWILWYFVSDKPSAGPAWIARNLSTVWVFLPSFALLYQWNSAWMLFVAALATCGMAFSLRRLLPLAAEASAIPDRRDAILPSLDGLPPADSPLALAFSIAILAQASIILAAGVSLLLGSLLLAIGVFLFAWRWSASEPRAARWWTGTHPPLRQVAFAILFTALTLIPWSVGHRFDIFGAGRPYAAASPGTRAPAQAEASNSGYFGIILYPPPQKKELGAPVLHSNSLLSSTLAKPMKMPFDGPYWYFKNGRRPGPKAHVARGRSTDVNVRSTDLDPLMMEAHQKLGVPIDLSTCGEIDVDLTNADTRIGEIDLALLLTDSTAPGRPGQLLHGLPIASSELDPIPANRAPVKETLRFTIPHPATVRRFDEITVAFRLAPRHGRAGAKISIDSFELMPKR